MPSAEAAIDDPSVVIEEKELVRFERADEYLSLLFRLVPPSAGSSAAAATISVTPIITPDEALSTLISILDEYQDQSNLLDPYLERIVSPPVEALQRHVRSLVLSDYVNTSDNLSSDSVTRLSKLVYAYTKVRGYKTIVHYFPHEVADLPATLSFLEQLQRSLENDEEEESSKSCWELRYVCLLWLSLICMIPFDLAKFDRPGQETHETTSSRIAAVAEHFITSPGKERDAAAVVLGRLFQRTDVQLKDHFTAFLTTSRTALESTADLSPFHATGILQALCEILKNSEPVFVVTHLASIQSIIEAYDSPEMGALASNGLVVKYQTKLTSRLALKLLRPRAARRRANKIHVLGASPAHNIHATQSTAEEDEDDESDIPDEIEQFISYLIEALQHKDTVVRYSAAKGLARLCDRLPTSFLNQVVEAIISLFHINIPDLFSGEMDLSSVSEHTWQGACMALAELSRRGMLFAEMLSEALPWILKALLFDVRRGAHSVGANVRDAACYVVWALARSNDIESIRPHAMELAQRLVAVATLDRDVSIRRAASAAFQESVGRLSLFSHGIDVIRMTDFYSVSVRRSAFLECAVNVSRFAEYQGYLVDHLLDVVTIHWDPAMRKLGAQSIALIAMNDPIVLMPDISSRLSARIGTSDTAVLHGTLLSLAEVCRLSRSLSGDHAVVGEEVRLKAFGLLSSVRPSAFRSLGAASILQAACQLIGAGFSDSTTSSKDETQTWEKVLNIALARQEEAVHVAAAEAVAHLSHVVDLSAKIRSTLDNWSTLTLPQQQSNALLLGNIDFNSHPQLFEPVIDHLIALTRPPTKLTPNPFYSANIEVRRNAMDSLTRSHPHILHLHPGTSHLLLPKIVQSLLVGLGDYTTDQRGDVGSWVRLSCITGLREILILLSRQEELVLEKSLFQTVIGALWKQAAERIDHVRHMAGCSVVAVYHAYSSLNEGMTKPMGYDVVKSAFGSGCLRPFGETQHNDEKEGADGDLSQTFKNPSKAYPRLCQLLTIPPYRMSILEGLLLSMGSKSDLGERIIGPSLSTLTTADDGSGYTLPNLLGSIFDLAKRHFGENRIFIPSIVAVSLLLENGSQYQQDAEDVLVRLVKMAMANVDKIKSVPRLLASATLCANLVLAISSGTAKEGKVKLLEMLSRGVGTFLKHPFPAVRTRMAEQLYAVLSSGVSFEDEEDEDGGQGEKLELWEEVEMALLDTKWGAAVADADLNEETVQSIVSALPRLLQ
ncbi:related to Tubulin-folding cofactor D [Ustilago trichophora]|uniref:Related to Tubulin-folding cofactor D n=1 Tax=Ustilago trichophora TaxID=86804 RepID=A0A5C3DUU4_9BASI|nr:related to Tubulin-folding cofactor D [Ustilago trichophora]